MISPEQVRAADPKIIFASWCGKPVDKAVFPSRPGWFGISAVRENRIHEIPGVDILKPGFGLVRGYEQLKHHIGMP